MTSFLKLAQLYEKLEATSSGNALRQILAGFFKLARPEIQMVAYLTIGQIASDFAGINLGMADRMVLRAIGEHSGKDSMTLFKKKGDVGLVAEQFCKQNKPALGITAVFDTLHKIAGASGPGSQEQKTRLLRQLLDKSTPLEARYIARLVLGKLRLGVADKTALDALAIAFTGSKASKPAIDHAYSICPDVGIIAEALVKKGLKGIENIDVMVGRPIQMMLCQRLKTLKELPEHMNWPVAVEEKYDGERIQAHKQGSTVTLFSRRLENITLQFPEVAAAVKNLPSKTLIIEGEAVPVDSKGNLLPFQTLMQRRRKHGIESYVKKIPIAWFVFDCLFADGKSLLRKSYAERFASLSKAVKETKTLKFANRKVCSDVDCVEELFQEVLEHGGEGIVIKSLAKDAVYKAGMRGWHWIKWKPEYAKELQDTFDLAVVGAFYGKGKRSGSYGALLCAVYNEELDRFETFCKLGSGFSDDELKELPKILKNALAKHKPARVQASKGMTPDVWFEPLTVVEVLGSEITKSPTHTAGWKAGQGLALRFPRFVKWRKDKKPEQATTVKEIQ